VLGGGGGGVWGAPVGVCHRGFPGGSRRWVKPTAWKPRRRWGKQPRRRRGKRPRERLRGPRPGGPRRPERRARSEPAGRFERSERVYLRVRFGARAWRRFKRNRLGYRSLLIFCVLVVGSLFAELLSNDRPLIVRYEGHTYFPLVKDYAETVFGGDFDAPDQHAQEYSAADDQNELPGESESRRIRGGQQGHHRGDGKRKERRADTVSRAYSSASLHGMEHLTYRAQAQRCGRSA